MMSGPELDYLACMIYLGVNPLPPTLMKEPYVSQSWLALSWFDKERYRAAAVFLIKEYGKSPFKGKRLGEST